MEDRLGEIGEAFARPSPQIRAKGHARCTRLCRMSIGGLCKRRGAGTGAGSYVQSTL